MLNKFRYILSPIALQVDENWGAYIQLIDYEHRDYIEDVLCEYFDIEYAFRSNEDNTGDYVLYFEDKYKFKTIEQAITQINEYHKINKREYKVI
ncbi:hypothetical protein ACMAZF_09510 [Psychrobium sp. nBUS_13]|uniref:hypothetical protein n=1 Tax=Psychrobium sp. nBUS_13 TaxID=3395319 RepID=UPI003EBC534E